MRALSTHAVTSLLDAVAVPCLLLFLPGGEIVKGAAMYVASLALGFWSPMAVALLNLGKLREAAAEAVGEIVCC